MAGDTVTVFDDVQPGEPLLQPVMRGGRRLGEAPPLAELRAATAQRLAHLPEALRRLEPAPPYPVTTSEALRELCRIAPENGG